jgi:hypothetical protein
VIVGATIDPREYERRVPLYPDSRMCRVFGYPSKGLPTWSPETGDKRIARLRELVPGIIPAAVFQDWRDDATARALVTAWLDQVDAPARLCWRHEADRKREDSTVYRRRYFVLAELLQDHPNGHHITLTPTSTYQWTLSKAAGKGQGDWSRYHVGVGTPAIDVYADSWRGDYPDPAAFLAPLWRYRDLIGQAIEFPEFGAARLPVDVDGRRRAEWLTVCADIMAVEGVTAVSYWDDLGSNATDLRLSRSEAVTPEIEAWRDVMRRYNVTA